MAYSLEVSQLTSLAFARFFKSHQGVSPSTFKGSFYMQP